jgi:hypothetical protein
VLAMAGPLGFDDRAHLPGEEVVLGEVFFEGDDAEEVGLWGDRDDHLLTRRVTAKIKRHEEK